MKNLHIIILLLLSALLSAKTMVIFKSDSSCTPVFLGIADSGKLTSANSMLSIYSKSVAVNTPLTAIDSIKFFDAAITLSPEMLYNGAFAAPAYYDSLNSNVTIDLRNRTVAESCVIITDPLDLSDYGNGTVAGNRTLTKVLVRVKASIPAGSTIKCYWSVGNSFFTDSGWSSWNAASGVNFDIAPVGNKFIKVRLVLKAALITEKPLVKGMTICADLSPADRFVKGLQITSFENEKIVKGPYPFGWEDRNNATLKALITRFRLDTCGKDSTTEFGKVLALLDWIARRPNVTLSTDPYPWDINQVITQTGTINGHCMSYAEVMISALTALGMYARHWAIEGIDNNNNHEVVEYWSNTMKKWIYLDPSLDTYYKSKSTGTPLSIIEMHNIYVNKQPITCVDAKYHYGVYTPTYNWSTKHGYTTTGHMKLTERNNFHSQSSPTFNGFGQGFCGFTDLNMWHNWTDKFTPPYNNLHYNCGGATITCHSGRMRDYWYTLNQASCKAKRSGENTITVEFGNSQPFFSHYTVSINGQTAVNAGSPYSWTLANGTNTLEVTPVNTYGEKGIPSRINIIY
ncbi:MAG: transglutaminase domain-containing protein [Fibrobacteres bacterium]|nr:transglutaminase domain-containing protein [Fibrobacterota bacterium]